MTSAYLQSIDVSNAYSSLPPTTSRADVAFFDAGGTARQSSGPDSTAPFHG
jgi:hypothetical protein